MVYFNCAATYENKGIQHMKINSAQLKEISRKLRGIGGELFNFDGKVAYSKVDNLDVIVDFPLECAAPFAVSAEKFSQVVARLEGEVSFELLESKVSLKSKKSKITLPISEARPCTQKEDNRSQNEYRLSELLPALNFALQASVRSVMQSYSGAVSFSKRCAAGSDGFRLSVSETGAGPEEAYVIPAPAVEALKIFTAPQLSISQDEQNMYFIGGDTKLIARRYVRAFPPFEKLIPTSTTLNFEFKRDELLNGLKSLNPLAEEKQKIMLTISGDECIMNLASQQGSGDVTIPASGADDFLPFEALLPFEFVQDFVESVRGPAIFLRANTEKGPFLLESGKFKLIIAGSR